MIGTRTLPLLQASFILFACAALLQANDDKAADKPKVAKQSFSYKKVDNTELIADVFRPDDGKARPIVLHVHGGALMAGGRYMEPAILDWFLENGFILVSFDYRLAPFVKMPDIYEDVKDAYRWTRANAKKLFNGDAERIVVAGPSAGGYLTFASGTLLDPRPKVLFAASGYGNIIAPWYAEPYDYYRKVYPLLDKETVTKALKDNPLNGKTRADFYIWSRQAGLWPNILVGHDPKTEPEKFVPYCPVQHVTKDYPPVVFIHATLDYDVPYSESKAMEEQFKKHGVDHLFLTVPGNYHAWSTIHPKVDPDGKNRQAIMAFLLKRL